MSNSTEALQEMRACRDRLEQLGYTCVLLAAPLGNGPVDGLIISNIDEAASVDMMRQVIENIASDSLQDNPPPSQMLN